MSVLDISLFGATQITIAEQPIHKFPTSRALALLVALASTGQPEQRDYLATLLWPDKPAELSRVSLRQCLRRLKQAVGKSMPDASQLVLASQNTLQLNLEICGVDVLEMNEILGRLNRVREVEEPEATKRDLVRLAELYRGRFLDRFVGIDSIVFQEWLEAQQAYWQDRALKALAQLAEMHMRDGELEEALSVAQRFVELEPWDENGHQLVLESFWRLGNRAGAMQHYEEMVAEFDEELGVEPSARTQTIYQKILSEEPPRIEAKPAEPADAPVKTPFMAPPIHSIVVGREDFASGITSRLVQQDDIALYGLPGVGKTTMASVIAGRSEIETMFPDGVLWVGLGQNPDVQAEITHWSHALGIEPKRLENLDSVRERANLIHRTIQDRQMLLVIDDAWDLETALLFRLGGRRCVHLITTRYAHLALDFAGSMAIQLPEFSAKAGLDLLGELAPEAIAAEPAEAQNLVEAVGALPLALVLIGKYLQKQSHHKQTRRLKRALEGLRAADQRLGLSQPQTPIDRHPSLGDQQAISLKSVIGLSDEMLPPAAHNALIALALFSPKPNRFSESAACDVIAGDGNRDDALNQLDLLVDHGLLEPVGNARYTLHSTIADYAQQFPADPQTIERFVDHHVGFVEAHSHDFTAIEDEYSNVREALRMAAAEGMSTTFAQGVFSLYPYLENWALRDETQALLDQGDQMAAKRGDECAEAYLAHVRGRYLNRIGKRKEAEPFYVESLRLSKQQEIKPLHADSLLWYGQMLSQEKRFDETLDTLNTSLELAGELKDPFREAQTLVSIGRAYYYMSRQDLAQFYFQKALQLRDKVGDVVPIGASLQNIGVTLAESGEFEEAIQYYEDALGIYQKLDATILQGMILNNLGLAYKNLGQWSRADLYLERALVARRQVEDHWGEAHALGNLGILRMMQADYEQARTYIKKSMRIAKQYKIDLIVGRQCDNLARLHSLEGNHAAAIEISETALEISEQLNNHAQMAGFANFRMGQASIGLEEYAEAERFLTEAMRHWLQLETQYLVVEASAALAEVYFAQGKLDEAKRSIKTVIAFLNEGIAGLEDPIDTYLIVYRVLSATNPNAKAAAVWLTKAEDLLEAQAENIEDLKLRAQFRSRPPTHQRLASLLTPKQIPVNEPAD